MSTSTLLSAGPSTSIAPQLWLYGLATMAVIMVTAGTMHTAQTASFTKPLNRIAIPVVTQATPLSASARSPSASVPVVLQAEPQGADIHSESTVHSATTWVAVGAALFAPLAAVTALVTKKAHQSTTVTTVMKPIDMEDGLLLGRRSVLGAAAVGAAAVTWPLRPSPAIAASGPRIVVAGATGATGKLAVKALQDRGVDVVAGARNLKKAAPLGVPVVPLDVTGSPDQLVQSLQGADVVVSCMGFTPGNPFEFAKAAHAVDNVGTIALIDAAKKAGVKRFVLMSSILTNGRAIGQDKSPGFIITNAFGGVLDEKLVAEKHLRASGLDWVIVRPGGLEGKAQEGDVALSGEDTLFSGNISRALVAQVLAEAALSAAPSINRVVEVVEPGTCVPGTCPAGLTGSPQEKWFA